MIHLVSRITFTVILFFSFLIGSIAQDELELRLIKKSVNCEMRRLVVELQVRSTDASVQLGTSSILLQYDPYVLSFESYDPNFFNAYKSCGDKDWAEQDWDGKSKSGTFNLTLHRLKDAGNCHTINTSWKKIGQLFFNIKKEAINPDLQIPLEYSILNQQNPNDGTQSFSTAVNEIVNLEAGLCHGEIEEQCEAVFSEIFSSDKAQWQSKSNAQIVDGALSVTNKGNIPIRTIIGQTWTDYILELDATIEHGKAGIVFRYQNTDNYYMWQISEDGLLRPHRRINGSWEILDYVAVGTQLGVRYRIKIQVEGNQITTWINDSVVDQRTDDYLSKGRIGFRQNGEELAIFDNINVCVPNISACSSSNIALGKQVSQSSVHEGGIPQRANDGNPNGVFSNNSVTATQQENTPWWEIDLGAVHNISHIRISNRTDCCMNNLQKFQVFISDEPFQSYDLEETLAQAGVKKMYRNGKPNSRASFLVNRTGRYVRVQLTEEGVLSLAEVEIMGCPIDQGGLLATYFDNADLTAPRLTRVDRQIDFNWGHGSPHTNIAKDAYSVRWEGEVRPPVTGTYKFWTRSNDGDRLWIDGNLVIDDWTTDTTGWQSAELDLIAGEKVSIRMEYFEEVKNSRAQLAWSYPGQSRVIIPAAYLNPRAGGLLATYFNDSNLGERMFTRVDKQVDFIWTDQAPHSTLGTDHFSVRWEGELEPLYSEAYTFTVNADEGIRLWIDNQLIIDQWQAHSGETSGQISLQAGQRVALKLEYYENTGDANAQLFWESNSQAKAIIPSFYLYPKANTLAFGEVGLVKAKNQWLEVELEGTYLNPVIIAGGPSQKNDEGIVVRIKDVGSTSFKIRVQEWKCQNGGHPKEDIPYFVVESGIHILPNGQRLIAGNLNGVTHDETMHDYPKTFDQAPILLTQLASFNGGDPAITRATTTAESFTVQIQEGEDDGNHTAETISWIALEPGLYYGNMKFEANREEGLTSEWKKLSFGHSYEEKPIFIAATGSKNEADPYSLRYDHTTLSIEGVSAHLQEESCGDSEIVHGEETVHYLSFEQAGLITSLPMDFLVQQTEDPMLESTRSSAVETVAEQVIYEESSDVKLQISPNPAKTDQSFHLHITTRKANELVRIELYDAKGSSVKVQNVMITGTEGWIRFDTHQLDAGLFFVKVVGLEWEVSRKVVLQK